MRTSPIRNTNVVDLIDECYVFNACSRKSIKTGKNVVSEAPDDPTCQYEFDQLLKIKRGGNHIYKIIRAQTANLDRNLDRVLTQREYRNLKYKIRAFRLAVRRYIPAGCLPGEGNNKKARDPYLNHGFDLQLTYSICCSLNVCSLLILSWSGLYCLLPLRPLRRSFP